jgi:transcriptional regulator with XRE-family HTH domain
MGAPEGRVAGPEPSPQQRLVDELRRVKRGSGLSYTRLESMTPYSRASLERYVNGKLFPTRQAVRDIAKACGSAPERLLELWEAADSADQPPATAQPEAHPRARRPSRRRMITLAALVGLLSLTGITGLVAVGDDTDQRDSPADGCRDYYADFRVYTVGRMCWTAQAVTVTGEFTNQAERAPASTQLCLSNRPDVCVRTIELATAAPGQTKHYEDTENLPPGYGAWIRSCLGGYCGGWK